MKQTDRIFKCGNSILNIVDSYTYLGVLLTEHLDFELTAKFVAQSASRALGLLIAKYKLAGGLPYNVYTNYTNLSFVRLLNIVLVFGDLNPTRV